MRGLGGAMARAPDLKLEGPGFDSPRAFFVSLGKTLYLHYFSPRSKMVTWFDGD